MTDDFDKPVDLTKITTADVLPLFGDGVRVKGGSYLGVCIGGPHHGCRSARRASSYEVQKMGPTLGWSDPDDPIAATVGTYRHKGCFWIWEGTK